MANKRKRRILFLFIVPALVFYLVFWIPPVLMPFFYGLTTGVVWEIMILLVWIILSF